MPNLLQWRLTVQLRDIIAPAVSLSLPNDATRLSPKDPEAIQVTVSRIGNELLQGVYMIINH